MKYVNKNTLLILIAILLVGGSFVYAEYNNKLSDNIYTAKDLAVVDTNTDSPQDIDTDGDGSKDWEEILVGSNPKDPKSKPSKDKNAVTLDITKSDISKKLDPVDMISREFFARYMELRQIGGAKDKASQEELARTTAGNIVLSKPTTYGQKDISIKSDNSIESVKSYGLEVGLIFKKYTIKSRNEAIIAKESIEKEDSTILKEIDPIITSNKNIINSLIKISVPQSMSTMHIDLLNAMSGSLFVAQSFRNSMANPIDGVQAVQYYTVVQKNLLDSINAIKSYLNYLGIYDNVF